MRITESLAVEGETKVSKNFELLEYVELEQRCSDSVTLKIVQTTSDSRSRRYKLTKFTL